MRNALVPLLAIGLLVPTLVVVPEPASAFVSDIALSGLFLARNQTGAVALAFTPPLNEEAGFLAAGVAKSPQSPAPALLCARVPVETAPAPLCGSAVLGSTITPASFQVRGDAGLQLWLSTDLPRLPIRNLILRVEHVNATGATATIYQFDYASHGAAGTQIAPRESDGLANGVVALDSTPRRIAFGDPRPETFNVTQGDTLRLVLDAVMTPLTGNERAQVRVHYGADMPSGAVFPVIGQDAWRVRLGTETLALRLRDDNLTFYPLDNQTDQTRSFPADRTGAITEPSLPDGSRLRWGPTLLDEGTRIVGAGLAEIWLQTAASTGANPQVAVDVTVSIGPHSFRGGTHTALNTAATAGLSKLIVPIRTEPVDVVGGMDVTIDIELYGLNATKFSVVYGSVNHTSGVVFPALGGGLVRPVVFVDPLPFKDDPAQTPNSTAGPETPAEDPETPKGEEEEDDGSQSAEGTPEDEEPVNLKENEPKGRSPGLGVASLVAVLLGGALLSQRGRAGKPS